MRLEDAYQDGRRFAQLADNGKFHLFLRMTGRVSAKRFTGDPFQDGDVAMRWLESIVRGPHAHETSRVVMSEFETWRAIH